MKKLLALLLLSPLVVSEEDRWWENLGIYNNLYDTLIAETFEQREARFFDEAENIMSLGCRSEIAFNATNRDMRKCREEANNSFVKPIKDLLLYSDSKKVAAYYKYEGLKLTDGSMLKYIDPSFAAILMVASNGAMLQNCIPENIGQKNTYNQIYIPGCVKHYEKLRDENLRNADKYVRLKYLERRGLLISNKIESIPTDEILSVSSNEMIKLSNKLQRESVGVFCRSALGLLRFDHIECEKHYKKVISNFDEYMDDDLKLKKLNYLNNELIRALYFQYFSLTLEKCVPHTKILDKNLDLIPLTEDYINILYESWYSCSDKSMESFYDAAEEANLILKREALWKKEQERKRQEAIKQAKLQKEKERLIAEAERQKQSQRESAGSFFGRLLAAAIVESADAYIQDKIAKELNIKTGIYHSQDSTYCYYTSPTGMKRLKKKSGKSKTINYGNVGTNKPVITYKKMPSGWTENNTIYSFSNGTAMNVKKTTIYDCPSRID